MFKRERDLIDRILAEQCSRPGLIDWELIDQRLAKAGAVVDRRVLHKRVKEILRSRPGVKRIDRVQKRRFW